MKKMSMTKRKRKIERELLNQYARAKTPRQRASIAKHITRVGIEMIADANGIETDGLHGETFVDRKARAIAVFLEPDEPPIPLDDMRSHSDDAVPLLLGAVAQCAREFGMPVEEIVGNIVANIHVWRNPPPEAYN